MSVGFNLPSHFARLVGAIFMSFIIFTSIPFVRGIVGLKRPVQRPVAAQRRVIAEMVRMPQSKTPAPVKAMPRVASPSQERLGSMDQNGLSFKISPDLNVESGEGAGITLQGRELEAMVFEEGQTDENVLPLFMPSVNYPQRARELGIQGTLKAIITIDRDGTVVKVDIVKSPHQSISEEAKKTIMTWKFKPAKIKGIPVKVRRVQDIEFKLDGE